MTHTVRVGNITHCDYIFMTAFQLSSVTVKITEVAQIRATPVLGT